MGRKFIPQLLKSSIREEYPDSWNDLFSVFIEKSYEWIRPTGILSMVTMQSWMFLSSFEEMRYKVLTTKNIFNLVQIGYNSFPELNSKVAQACAFSLFANKITNYQGSYIGLDSDSQSADKNKIFLERVKQSNFVANQEEFSQIPGCPISYWVDASLRSTFQSKKISDKSTLFQGMITGDNDNFVRSWYEVDYSKVDLNAWSVENLNLNSKYWLPYNKGGESIK